MFHKFSLDVQNIVNLKEHSASTPGILRVDWGKFNVDLYWIIKNVIIYCEYTLKFSVFEVIYFIFL